jgi:hypothetical protein
MKKLTAMIITAALLFAGCQSQAIAGQIQGHPTPVATPSALGTPQIIRKETSPVGSFPIFTAGLLKPMGLHFHVVAKDKDGNIIAIRDPDDLDLITTVGAQALINNTFAASGYTSAWYMGEVLGSAPTFVIGDTMGGHGGWAEEGMNDITNTTRPTILPIVGMITASGTNNTAVMTPAVFTQNSPTTFQGFYIVDSNVKAGTSGILYGELPVTPFSVVATNQVTVTVSIITVSG